MSDQRRSRRVAAAILFGVAIPLFAGTAACDRSSSNRAEAESPEQVSQKTGADESQQEGDNEESGEDGEEEGHHESHEVRLGIKMQHIAHRFAAVWYTGRSGSKEMLDYQIHELEETIDGLVDADVEEHGVEVGKRLEEDVLARVEKLEKQAEAGDKEAFEKQYRETIGQCNDCHADTEHGFIDVGVPERNPYVNVDLTGSGE